MHNIVCKTNGKQLNASDEKGKMQIFGQKITPKDVVFCKRNIRVMKLTGSVYETLKLSVCRKLLTARLVRNANALLQENADCILNNKMKKMNIAETDVSTD